MFRRKLWETFRDTFKAFVLYLQTVFEDGQTVFIRISEYICNIILHGNVRGGHL
jgi:hypothetical protein